MTGPLVVNCMNGSLSSTFSESDIINPFRAEASVHTVDNCLYRVKRFD